MLSNIKQKIKDIISPQIRVKKYKIVDKLEKLGTAYGGWIIPVNQLNGESVCYLAGAGEDISFDVALAAKYHSKIFIFDPTPRSKTHFDNVVDGALSGKKVAINNDPTNYYDLSKEAVSHFHFRDIGIWKETASLKFFAPKDESHISHSISNLQDTTDFFEARVDRLSNILKNNKHDKLDLLKLDIEGAEYEVIDTILEDKLPVKILCIEFHLSKENGLAPIYQAISKLESANYRIIARENLDITFINKNIYGKK